MLISKLCIQLLLFVQATFASSGDRLPEFNDCVSQCVANRCPSSVGLLALLAWDCPSNCDYVCQQALTDVHEEHHMRVHQYHGKWPFRRWFGVQEIASVVFSLLNMVPHFIGYRALQKQTRDSEQFRMRSYYLSFAVVGVNTWVWSSVFHLRDLPVTEKLDYFSAIGSILGGLFLAIVRFYRLDMPAKRPTRNIVFVTIVGFYACHIFYLSFIKFNYAYNMMAGVVVGVAQVGLWIVLSMSLYVRSKNKMDLLPIGLVLSVFLGLSFELNDFSPYWRTVDAHSLWHASTVLPSFFWYKWMIFDLNRHTHPHRYEMHQYK